MSKGSKVVGIAPFKPEYWQQAPLLDKSKTLLLWGPSGGGKSHVAAEKLHAFALHYPGATVVASRKKFDDMQKSTIPLFLDTIIDEKHAPNCTYRARESRVVYDHGPEKPSSELIFTGIFDEKGREGLKSIGKKGAVDMWWMEEGTEFEEEDYNIVLTRLRGTAAPWTQVIVTTNPGPKLHWIRRRLIIGGEASSYYSDATMNRYNAADYMQTLKKLTGIDRARLYEGKWVDGSGAVIDSWSDQYNAKTGDDRDGNVTLDADYIPGSGPVVWVVDDGYSGEKDPHTGLFTDKSQPRAFLLCQKRGSRLVVFDEEYDVQVLAGDHIQRVKKMSEEKGYPLPEYVVHDGAAPSFGGSLIRAGFKPIAIRCKIEEGIKELREWVGEDFNGLRRLIVHPRCQMLRLEMGSYAYDKHGTPIDAFNHGIDALRYLTWHETYGQLMPAGAATYPEIDMAAIDLAIAEAKAKIEKAMMERYNATA